MITAKEMTREQRIARIQKLIDQFTEGKQFFMSNEFVESECRSKFIDPFLECLGWDVKNEKGARHDRQEVITEDRVEIEGAIKHPDYTLCYGGERKFYIEAKQPSVKLKTDPEPARQVRRYAYTSKMPIAVLTDFQELVIYDTRIKPKYNDGPEVARIDYYTYEQYVEKFDEIYNKISWDAVDLGNYDSYYEGTKDKRGTASVDDDILEMIEGWRVMLAQDIALKNKDLDEYNLTAAVQKIIDRILFLRICEDKEIEERNTLKNIADSKVDIYAQLKVLFAAANQKFNAGLFATDTFLDSLIVPDKSLKDIINALYYPLCPYEFSVLPVEILGSIYERFLGKTIRLGRKTKYGHSVYVEEKPEVQKAGGVYYTPSYIVRYIVEQTIGKKLIEAATPEKASSIKVCDPACGSGSFLVGAYQYLLDWHLDYYDTDEHRDSAEKRGTIYKDARTHKYKLSVEEKRRILLNNIYGVDIDAQAVEVTKLSLFLKLLENEGKALSSTGQSTRLRASDTQKILPNMSNNIKCGNSLVGSDYYADKDITLFGIVVQRKINVFDWKEAFPLFFADGGFDCIIGNPPYVFARESGDKGMDADLKNYYYTHYKMAQYQINLYHLFIEKSCSLLADGGNFGFIVPNNWLTINSNKGLRKFILQKSQIVVVNFKFKVFDKADVDTSIITLQNDAKPKTIALYESEEPEQFVKIHECETSVFLEDAEHIINIDAFKNQETAQLLKKIENSGLTVADFADVKAGLQAYEVGKGKPVCTKEMKEKRIYHSMKKESTEYYKYLQGADVCRYEMNWSGEYLKYGNNLAAPRTFNLYSTPRILVRQIPSKPPYCINACFVTETILNDRNSMNIINITCEPLFLLAVLNSRLISFWFEHKFGKLSRGTFPQFKINELKQFPMPSVEPHISNQLTNLANQRMDAAQQLASAKSPSDQQFIQQRCNILDKQINAAVYKLYGLTDDEIAIVEK